MKTARTSSVAPAGWLCALLLTLGGMLSLAEEPRELPKPAVPPAGAARPPGPWERIAMVGASASAGFTLAEPFGGTNTLKCRLSPYIDAALIAPHEPVRNFSSALFFLNPEEQGPKQIGQALKAQPKLVLAADFLFWFCYGAGSTDEERLQRLEGGLKLLEPVQCPLLLGDIPDASAAVNGMLSPRQIPSTSALSAANRRVRDWAASRPHVVILPLASFMRAAMANQALTVHGRILPAGKTRSLLQDDNLHPTPRGSAILALAMLDALQSAKPDQFAGEMRWDPEEVLRLGSKPPQRPSSQPVNPDSPAVPAAK